MLFTVTVCFHSVYKSQKISNGIWTLLWTLVFKIYYSVNFGHLFWTLIFHSIIGLEHATFCPFLDHCVANFKTFLDHGFRYLQHSQFWCFLGSKYCTTMSILSLTLFWTEVFDIYYGANLGTFFGPWFSRFAQPQ